MKEIQFRQWPEALAQTSLPERQKASWAITLRWYLNFCRRGRAAVTVQSARDFIEWAQQEKRPQPWQLESWKEAIRWFFLEARKREAQGESAGGKSSRISASPPVLGREAEAPSSEPSIPNMGQRTSGGGIAAWKAAYLTVLRRGHYAYRTEGSYLVWLERFARYCGSDDLQSRGPEDIKGFLDELALNEHLSASSQKQALNAVVFLLHKVYGKELGDF